jgi:hypothetical protein
MYNKDLQSMVLIAIVVAVLASFAIGYALGHQSVEPEGH